MLLLLYTYICIYIVEEASHNNTFHFNGRFFSQEQGLAMGKKLGPSVACTFIGYLEEFFLPIVSTPHRRYVGYILSTSLELPHVLKKNYKVSLII